jgi:hypothetical protein
MFTNEQWVNFILIFICKWHKSIEKWKWTIFHSILYIDTVLFHVVEHISTYGNEMDDVVSVKMHATTDYPFL